MSVSCHTENPSVYRFTTCSRQVRWQVIGYCFIMSLLQVHFLRNRFIFLRICQAHNRFPGDNLRLSGPDVDLYWVPNKPVPKRTGNKLVCDLICSKVFSAVREQSLLIGIRGWRYSDPLKSCLPPRLRRAENLPPSVCALKFCPPPLETT